MMCVSTGPRICLICLLLYSWHSHAEEADVSRNQQQYDHMNTKSEHHHEVEEDVKELYLTEKDYFVTQLMNKYGNGVEMTYEGFEHLLHHLGLGGIIDFDHGVSCHKGDNSSEFLQIHLHHNHSADAISSSKKCIHEEEHSHEHNHDHGSHDHLHDDHEHIHDDHEHSSKEQEHSSKEYNQLHEENLKNTTYIHEHSGLEHADHIHEHNETVDKSHDHNEHATDSGKLEKDGSLQSDNDTHEYHEHDHGEEKDHNHEDGDDHGEHDHEHSTEDESNHRNSDDHTEHDHGDENDHEHNHADEHDHREHDHEHDHDHHRRKRATGQDECLPASVMLSIVQNGDQPRSITKEVFKEICPSLIYQIDADSCYSSHSHNEFGGHDAIHGDHDEHDHAAEAESSAMDLTKVPPKVWGFSAVAVIIISLVGLLGVAVIPIMQKVFYNHMLQFLVAMAVGALSGDALLHLLPHAIAGGHGDENGGHSHGSGGHSHDTAPIYKGLMGLLGIYFFFFTERVLTMFTEYKRKKKQKKNRKVYMKDEELAKVGDKLANSECDGMMMSIHPNKALRGYVDEAHSEHCTISFENTTTISHEHGQKQNCDKETCVDGDENTSMINSVNSTPKPRAHGHGHSHAVDGVPESVASVAWMVILGDGIHNFSDGLAIGAAFVNSMTGGFSTSVAVFCHELPHEIGDFAMLLRAGMSPKQAIIYNCLSSILCFVGMLIGVAIGNLEGASLWIFSIVGGMFLYIALVDMLPELSSVETKKGEHPLCHLLLQGIGMCIGAGIMLAIALYEEDLKTMLD